MKVMKQASARAAAHPNARGNCLSEVHPQRVDHDIHRLIHCVSGCGSAHKDGHPHLHSRRQLMCWTLLMLKVQAWGNMAEWLSQS